MSDVIVGESHEMLKSKQGFLQRSKKTVLLIIVVAAITIILHTMISIFWRRIDNYLIPSLGTIRTTGVKAYGGNITLNENGEQQINWGTIYPGTLTNRSFNVQSESNIETTLIFKIENWTFLDSAHNDVTRSLPTPHTDYMNITCAQNETTIRPDEIVYTTLTLSITSSPDFINAIVTNDVQEFSFDTHIKAKE